MKLIYTFTHNEIGHEVYQHAPDYFTICEAGTQKILKPAMSLAELNRIIAKDYGGARLTSVPEAA